MSRTKGTTRSVWRGPCNRSPRVQAEGVERLGTTNCRFSPFGRTAHERHRLIKLFAQSHFCEQAHKMTLCLIFAWLVLRTKSPMLLTTWDEVSAVPPKLALGSLKHITVCSVDVTANAFHLTLGCGCFDFFGIFSPTKSSLHADCQNSHLHCCCLL